VHAGAQWVRKQQNGMGVWLYVLYIEVFPYWERRRLRAQPHAG